MKRSRAWTTAIVSSSFHDNRTAERRDILALLSRSTQRWRQPDPCPPREDLTSVPPQPIIDLPLSPGGACGFYRREWSGEELRRASCRLGRPPCCCRTAGQWSSVHRPIFPFGRQLRGGDGEGGYVSADQKHRTPIHLSKHAITHTSSPITA